MAEHLTDATLAVLREMDWPDDRQASAHIEPDGYQVTPPGTYWDMAQDVAGAVISAMKAIIRADERAKVAEEIAKAIEADDGGEYGCCGCPKDRDYHAGIARRYATKPAETAVEAPAIARQHA